MIKPRALLVAAAVAAATVAALIAYRQMGAQRSEPIASLGPATAKDSVLNVRRALIPRPVPELRFIDDAGTTMSLADFRGRVVLLNIWATWCAPCRKEMPALDRLQATAGGPQFEVIALSIDRDGVPLVRRFYEELSLKALRIYVDTGSDTLAKLKAVGVPLTLLIDRQGNELWRVLGPAEWDQPQIIDLIGNEIGAGSK